MNKSILIKIPIAIVLVVVLLQMSGACHKATIEPGKVEAPAKHATPSQQAIAEYVAAVRMEEAVGTVAAITEVKLASEVGGRILEVQVQEGQRVSRGAVVARLDDRSTAARISEAQSGLAAAEAAAELARSQVERMRRLYEKEVATKVQLEDAESGWRQAAAAMEAARKQLRQTELQKEFSVVTAPVDGVVQKRLVDPGDLAVPGQTLVVLFGEDGLQFEAGVRENLAVEWELGAEFQVALPALGVEVTAVLREKQVAADVSTRTIAWKLDLPEVEALQVGMYGKLLIPMEDSKHLVAVKEAVHEVGQLHTMLVRDADGRWIRRHVRIGNAIGNHVEILSGLFPGETYGWNPTSEKE